MLKYRRAAIEIESPDQLGYDTIVCNRSKSSVTDARMQDLDLSLEDVVLQYGDHFGKAELRKLITEGKGVSSDDILLTVGATGALFIIATSLLKAGYGW